MPKMVRAPAPRWMADERPLTLRGAGRMDQQGPSSSRDRDMSQPLTRCCHGGASSAPRGEVARARKGRDHPCLRGKPPCEPAHREDPPCTFGWGRSVTDDSFRPDDWIIDPRASRRSSDGDEVQVRKALSPVMIEVARPSPRPMPAAALDGAGLVVVDRGLSTTP